MTGQGALSPGFAGFQNLDAQTHVDTRFAPVPESAQRAELESSDEFCTTTFRVVPHPSRGSTAFEFFINARSESRADIVVRISSVLLIQQNRLRSTQHLVAYITERLTRVRIRG